MDPTWTPAACAGSGRSPGPDSRFWRTPSASCRGVLRAVRGRGVRSTSSQRRSPRDAWTRTPRREDSCNRLGLGRREPFRSRPRVQPVDTIEELLEPSHPIPPGRLQGADVDLVSPVLEALEHPKSVVPHHLPRLVFGLFNVSDRMSELLRERGGEVSEG